MGRAGCLLICALVDGLRVYLEKIEDATRLARISGRRVTLDIYPAEEVEPSRPRTRPTSARSQILRRLDAEPGRAFRAGDFGGLSAKSAGSALSALYLRGSVDRVDRGRYKKSVDTPASRQLSLNLRGQAAT